VEHKIMSLDEFMRLHPHRSRICGWDPANPPEVERSFRAGFVIGASRSATSDLEAAADFDERMNRRRGDLYHNHEVWSDRRAALLRGAMEGGIEAVRARVMGVDKGLVPWLQELRAWTAENPIRLDWSNARPPEPPDPDGTPLGRKEVPMRLWSEVFGLWAVMTPPGWADANTKRAGPEGGRR